MVRRPRSRSRVPLGGAVIFALESVWARMYFRSSSGSQEHSAGGRKNLTHKNTQTNPREPVIMKETRHPSLSNSHATRGAENAGPAKLPALKMAVASPRSFAGNHWRITFPEVGKEAASPAPNANRVASILPKVVATPVSIPATDQIATDKAFTVRVLT